MGLRRFNAMTARLPELIPESTELERYQIGFVLFFGPNFDQTWNMYSYFVPTQACNSLSDQTLSALLVFISA